MMKHLFRKCDGLTISHIICHSRESGNLKHVENTGFPLSYPNTLKGTRGHKRRMTKTGQKSTFYEKMTYRMYLLFAMEKK